MLDVKSFNEDSPVPPVDPEDLKRVWTFVQSRPSRSGGTVGFTPSVIAEQCASQDPDPVAVLFRSSILTVLQSGGFLNDWREEPALRDIVFAAMARFPLPHGLAAFDVNAFLAELGQS